MTTMDVRLDILFKKYLGVPDANPNQDSSTELGISKPSVIPSLQIYAQTIPATAPTDLVIDSTFVPVTGGGTRKTSTLYPYIAFYTDLKLVDATASLLNTSFVYSKTQSANILCRAIPTNYDSVRNTYGIPFNVKDKNGTIIPSNSTTDPWIFDSDSGVLTFTKYAYDTGYKMTNYPPKISFFRYEGTIGMPSVDLEHATVIWQFD